MDSWLLELDYDATVQTAAWKAEWLRDTQGLSAHVAALKGLRLALREVTR